MTRVVSIIFIILLVFSSCKKKKNYPNDIPKWMKEKIDKIEDENRKRDGVINSILHKNKTCYYDDCRSFTEYNDGSSTFYTFADGSSSPRGFQIYNYDGVIVCSYCCTSFPCGNAGYQKNFVREIWKEG